MFQIPIKHLLYFAELAVGIYAYDEIPNGVYRSIAFVKNNQTVQKLKDDVRLVRLNAVQHEKVGSYPQHVAYISDANWAEYRDRMGPSIEETFKRFAHGMKIADRANGQNILVRANGQPFANAQEITGLSNSDYARAGREWSGRLRELQKAAREKERLRVLVDIQDID